MQIKVTYGNKATINTGNYENENPFYSITSEIDSSELKDSLSANKWAKQTLKDIKKIINSDLAKEVNRIKNLKIPLPHHRIDLIDGIKTPHVTDIITPIPPTYIKDLEKHGTVGSMLDSAFKNYEDELSDLIDDYDPETAKKKTRAIIIKRLIPKINMHYKQMKMF